MSNVTRFPRQPPKPPEGGPICPLSYFQRGLALITATNSAATIALGEPECEAWVRYFVGHLRWRPWALRALQSGEIYQMTVPTRWPEWFDVDYAKLQ